MDINAIDSSIIQRMVKGGGQAGEPPEGMRPHAGDGPRMGPMAQLLGGPEALTAEQQEEMKAFRETMRDALRNDEFDAESMADQAPEFLKEKAGEQGVDLASLLSDAQEKFDAMRSFAGGRDGGGNPYATGLEQAESSLLAMLGDEQE